jgi:ribosomal protein S18 acetylase RimI-like enzyme
MTITELRPGHAAALSQFFAGLPAGDLTFIKEDVTDPAQVRSLAVPASGRWLAVDDHLPGQCTVTGYLAVRRLPGWSDHVGEIRLVVHPAYRRAGLGRALARHALVQAVEGGLRKLVVELVADQQHAIDMFTALGFTGEALLRDHIRDRDGRLRDLVVLAHYVDETWAAMATVGLQEEMEGQ